MVKGKSIRNRENAFELLLAKRISRDDFFDMVLGNTSAKMRKKLRETETYAIGRQRHPEAQAGLPSLGKKRP